jgi:hypothetical protein
LSETFLAVNYPTSGPLNNTIAFFTGTDDYLMIRRYGEWLGKSYITMTRKDYVSLSQIKDVSVEVWNGRVYVSLLYHY